jgi:acetate CoA/acetoacetate CoA-transferase alpha subunit
LMALAADLVIVQVEQLVEIGEIDPDDVMTPGILVDKIFVQGGSR